MKARKFSLHYAPVRTILIAVMIFSLVFSLRVVVGRLFPDLFPPVVFTNVFR